MSLIPSESLSFPDDFSRSISRARVLHERQRYGGKREPAPVPPPEKEKPSPRIEQVVIPPPPPTPNVEVQKPKPVPRKPVIRNISTPKVVAQASARPPSAKRFGPVRLTKSPRISPKVIVDLAKEAQPAAPIPSVALPVERPAAEERVMAMPAIPRRRRKKLARFFKIEIPALLMLAVSAWAGLTHQFSNPIAVMILNAVTIAAAFVVAITPIALFAATPTLPPAER